MPFVVEPAMSRSFLSDILPVCTQGHPPPTPYVDLLLFRF
jgi:hypothetical protein